MEAHGKFGFDRNYHIMYQHVQLLTKRHRNDPTHGIGIEELSYQDPTWIMSAANCEMRQAALDAIGLSKNADFFESSTWFLEDQEIDIKARVVDDELLVRMGCMTLLYQIPISCTTWTPYRSAPISVTTAAAIAKKVWDAAHFAVWPGQTKSLAY